MAALPAALLIVLCPGFLRAASVNLAWDANTEPDLAGYRVHYGASSRSYAAVVDVGERTAATITGLAGDAPTYLAVTAYDLLGGESGYSDEIVFAPSPETISRPGPPEGPGTVEAGVSAVFTAGGAASSDGDPVQYRFSWSDGTDTDWLPVGAAAAAKAWTIAAAYTDVRVQARCSVHPSVLSPSSEPLTVIVTKALVERISPPSRPAGSGEVSDVRPKGYETGGAISSFGEPVQYRFQWGEGTVSPWLGSGARSAEKSWVLPGTYAVRAEARCPEHTGVGSEASEALDVRVLASPGEAISAPDTPGGPVDAKTGLVHEYATGNAVSSVADPLRYRFQWGDGTVSPWLAGGRDGRVVASKSWPVAAVYSVTAEAGCSLHPSVPAVSDALGVSVVGGGSLLFADTFSDGTAAGDPLWQALAGEWTVRADGGNKVFASGSLATANRAVVATIPELAAGRVATRARLTRGALARGAGIVFSWTDQRHYRYVLVKGGRIILGQVGPLAGERAGVKAAAAATLKPGAWQSIRVDLHPDGAVLVFLGRAAAPVLSYRFSNAVAGRIGVFAQKSVAHFDDFRLWDARAIR